LQGAFALNLKPNDNTWIANGNVRAIYTKGSVTYIGGDFTAVGPNTGRGAALDSTTASVDMRLPRVNNTISAAAPDG
jgi:hypothetical protein